MKLLTSIACFIVPLIFSILTSSCTKETIVRTDSTIIIKQDVAKIFKKKWTFLSHEIEQYSGSIFLNKKAENFVSNAFYNEFKANGTYANFGLSGNETGTWELLSDNYYVLDQNTANERYYYILSISESNFINRGPFTKNNQLLTNYLFTGYFKSAQ